MKIIDPMEMYRKVGLVELIQFVIIVFVYGLFCYLSFDLIQDYQEQKTGIHQFSNEVDELPLPSITICSQNVFKNIDKDLTQGFMKLILKNDLILRPNLYSQSLNSLCLEKMLWFKYRKVMRRSMCYYSENQVLGVLQTKTCH